MTDSEVLDLITNDHIDDEALEFYNKFFEKSMCEVPYSKDIVSTIECMTPPFKNFSELSAYCSPGLAFTSCRVFRNIPFPKEVLLSILGKSFTKGISSNHRCYPSAGGIYPIIPLLVVLNDACIEEISSGIYGIDLSNNQLLQLNDRLNIKSVRKAIHHSGEHLISPRFICYTYTPERCLVKYGIRGIRHAFIEIGEMAQSFRMIGRKSSPTFGDISWSGFNDKALMAGLGLKHLYPGMLQFFGTKKDRPATSTQPASPLTVASV